MVDQMNENLSTIERGQFVYVIAESSMGPSKIGIAANTKQRLAMLQTGNPMVLFLAFSVMVANSLVVERCAHAVLERHRMAGEWFKVSPDVAFAAVNEAIDMINEAGPEPEITYGPRRFKDWAAIAAERHAEFMRLHPHMNVKAASKVSA